MIGRFLSRAAMFAQFAFALLAAASAARFGASGFRVALAAATPAAEPDRARLRPPPSTRSARAAPSASAVPEIAAEKTGKPVSLTLAITAGSPRSEVYINGRRVGHSPFFGDISCKRGKPLKIEIVPDKGPLIETERACRSGLMRLNDSTLNDPY